MGTQISGDFWDDVQAKGVEIGNLWTQQGKTRFSEQTTCFDQAAHWVVDQYLAAGRAPELLASLTRCDNHCELPVLKKVSEFFLERGDRARAMFLCKRVVRVFTILYYEGLARFAEALEFAKSYEQKRTAEEIARIRAESHPVPVICTREDLIRNAHEEMEQCRSRVVDGIAYYDTVLKRIGAPDERVALAKLKEEILSGKPRKRVVKQDNRTLDEGVFWELLEETRPEAGDADHAQRIADALAGFKTSAISKFNKILYTMLGEANRYDLWAVAYIIRGGCGDDAFDYFRAWLVLQGKEAFERALANPETVADLVEKGTAPQAEELLYAAQQAYQDVKGEDLPKSAYPKPAKLQGKAWKEEELPKLYPKLSENYGFGR